MMSKLDLSANADASNYASDPIRKQQLGDFSTLTTVPSKIAMYANEPTTRAAMNEVTLPRNRPLVRQLFRIAKITVKPDGVWYGAEDNIVQYMEENDFTLIGRRCRRISFDECLSIWRYQWNTATIERMLVFSEIISAGESVELTFIDRKQAEIPASVRLRSLKGSAIAKNRDGNTLRDAINAPNRVMTLIHAPDEPIDILREAAIESSPSTLLDSMNSLLPDNTSYEKRAPVVSSPTHVFGGDTNAWQFLPTKAKNCLTSIDITDPHAVLDCASTLKPILSNGEWLTVVLWLSFYVHHDLPFEVCTIDEDGLMPWLTSHGSIP